MRRALVILLVLAGVFGGWAARGIATTPPSAGHVRGVVAFVGDSNVTNGLGRIGWALTFRDSPYAVVDLSRPGTTIRTPDCSLWAAKCTTFNYWKTRLAEAKTQIDSDAYVVNLGINDALHAGKSAAGPGYAFYDKKIDWLMLQLGDKPVYWTTLPCALEPAAYQPGCNVVNKALIASVKRWPNLTILGWRAEADGHPAYMVPRDVHYTSEGNQAWAHLVVVALNQRFPT